MKYQGYIISHGGYVRKKNEDNAFLNEIYRKNDDEFIWRGSAGKEDYLLAAVFDGMGGEANGEIASRISAETMKEMYSISFSRSVNEYAKTANERILQYSKRNHMGSTYVAVSVENNWYHFSNLGDSRGYLYRDGKFVQISKDHNMVQELLKMGVLTPEQAKRHPDRHALYQFLGMEEEDEIPPEPYVAEAIQAKAGDICLLCSDGLTEMIEETDICDVLSQQGKLEDKAEVLLQLALGNGGKDNVTILLIECHVTDETHVK